MLVASHSASTRDHCSLPVALRALQLPAVLPRAYRRGPEKTSARHQHLLLSLDVLDAELVGPARQEFIELRLGGPDNLVLQHLYQPVDRGIADYGLERPVILVLKVYEHREGLLPLLKDGREWDHVIRHGRLQFERCRPRIGDVDNDEVGEVTQQPSRRSSWSRAYRS